MTIRVVIATHSGITDSDFRYPRVSTTMHFPQSSGVPSSILHCHSSQTIYLATTHCSYFDDGVRYPLVTNESYVSVRPLPFSITSSPTLLPATHNSAMSNTNWDDAYNAWPAPTDEQRATFFSTWNEPNQSRQPPPRYVPSPLRNEPYREMGFSNPPRAPEMRNSNRPNAAQGRSGSGKRRATELNDGRMLGLNIDLGSCQPGTWVARGWATDIRPSIPRPPTFEDMENQRKRFELEQLNGLDRTVPQLPDQQELVLYSMLPLTLRHRSEPPRHCVTMSQRPDASDFKKSEDLVDSAVELYDMLLLKGICPNIEILTQRALLARHSRPHTVFEPLPTGQILLRECHRLSHLLTDVMGRPELDLELLPTPAGTGENYFNMPHQWHRYALGEYLLYRNFGVNPYLPDLAKFAGLVDGDANSWPGHELVDLSQWLAGFGCRDFELWGETGFVEAEIGQNHTLELIGLPGMVAVKIDPSPGS